MSDYMQAMANVTESDEVDPIISARAEICMPGFCVNTTGVLLDDSQPSHSEQA